MDAIGGSLRVNRPTAIALGAAASLIAVGLLLPAAVRADAGRERNRLDRLEREIVRLEQEMQRLESEEQGVLGRLDQLAARARLLDARREALQLEQQELEQELERLTREERAEMRALEAARERLAQTAVLLHRVGPLARVRPLLETRDADRLAGGLRLVQELTRRRQEEVAEVRQRIARVQQLREERRRRQEELEELSSRVTHARAELRRTIRARKRLLDELRDEQSVREQALAELRRARRELGEILREGGEGAQVSLDVRRFKGLLPKPVDARVDVPFGDRRNVRFGTVLPHPGWDLDARFGAPVRAIFDGRVVYADWFRGYGLVVVVDHGHRVHSVFAHLSAILVEKGKRIAQGQTIGRVGDTGSLKGPYLYMEIRVDGKAVDPASWIR
jgi:septal ring factor EnvC (AmiA/AmiB activator)